MCDVKMMVFCKRRSSTEVLRKNRGERRGGGKGKKNDGAVIHARNVFQNAN